MFGIDTIIEIIKAIQKYWKFKLCSIFLKRRWFCILQFFVAPQACDCIQGVLPVSGFDCAQLLLQVSQVQRGLVEQF